MNLKWLTNEVRAFLKDRPELNRYTGGEFAFSEDDIGSALKSAKRKINSHGGIIVTDTRADQLPEYLVVEATSYYALRSELYLKTRNKHVYRDGDIQVDRESNIGILNNLVQELKVELEDHLNIYKANLNITEAWNA